MCKQVQSVKQQGATWRSGAHVSGTFTYLLSLSCHKSWFSGKLPFNKKGYVKGTYSWGYTHFFTNDYGKDTCHWHSCIDGVKGPLYMAENTMVFNGIILITPISEVILTLLLTGFWGPFLIHFVGEASMNLEDHPRT